MSSSDPVDCSSLGSSVHRIFQARTLPYPPPGDLLNPGIKPVSLTSPALAGGFFTTVATCEAQRSPMNQMKWASEECKGNTGFEGGIRKWEPQKVLLSGHRSEHPSVKNHREVLTQRVQVNTSGCRVARGLSEEIWDVGWVFFWNKVARRCREGGCEGEGRNRGSNSGKGGNIGSNLGALLRETADAKELILFRVLPERT